MHKIAVSALSLFMILPAMADARLPVVNLAAGGVSARSAFGEAVSTPRTEMAVVAAAQPQPKKQPRQVIARAAKQPAVAQKSVAPATRGGEILATNDVLTPRRPNIDLWAHYDTPLRMPDASEFAVYNSSDLLPEEDLNTVASVQNVASRPMVVASEPVAPLSEIDNQIARLNELQRRANASVDTPKQVAVAEPVQPTVDQPVKPAAADIKLSRLVVPMDTRDVVVRAVEKSESPRIVSMREDMTKMSPSELRKAFRKTFLSENKHLSTYQIDNRFDVASDMTTSTGEFTARRDLSETGGIRPLEIKIKFRNEDSSLSRDNFNLLTEYAGIVVSNPTRAIQIGIPQNVTTNADARKLAARRLAIVEQALRDSGVSEQRIMPVLSQRNDDGFVLRMISNQQYETLSQQKRDMFGDTVAKKTYKSLSW